MQIAKPSRWLFRFLFLWIITVLTLGLWWLYVAYKLAITIEENQIQNIIGDNFYNMIKWEGIFFFILLMIISCVVIFLFFRDIKKTQSLQNFFASLTHELKTPLANIKLQAEFLGELLVDSKDQQIKKRLNFLTNGTYDLEEQFDNMLQLSKIEQNANIPLISINLYRFINAFIQKPPYENLKFDIKTKGENFDIQADEFALKVIFRNLLENTKRHGNKDQNLVTLKINEGSEAIEFNYDDHGPSFQGDYSKLGELFYKHKSHQGSGIGLYLIRRISDKMLAKFKINLKEDRSLDFTINFKKVES